MKTSRLRKTQHVTTSINSISSMVVRLKDDDAGSEKRLGARRIGGLGHALRNITEVIGAIEEIADRHRCSP